MCEWWLISTTVDLLIRNAGPHGSTEDTKGGQEVNDCRSFLQLVEDTLSTGLTSVLNNCCYTYIIIPTCFVVEIQNSDNKSKYFDLFCATMYSN